MAVELHGLDASVSLHQLRQLCSQAGPCLQVLAALEGGEAGSGLALAVFASEAAASQACDLLNNYPLGSAFLRVQRAQSLPGQLIDLLWSVLEVRTGAGVPPRPHSRWRGRWSGAGGRRRHRGVLEARRPPEARPVPRSGATHPRPRLSLPCGANPVGEAPPAVEQLPQPHTLPPPPPAAQLGAGAGAGGLGCGAGLRRSSPDGGLPARAAAAVPGPAAPGGRAAPGVAGAGVGQQWGRLGQRGRRRWRHWHRHRQRRAPQQQ